MPKNKRTITLDDREIRHDEPVWGPLLELLGERLTGDFMWMHAVVLSGDCEVHAYKHIDTRCYIHMDAELNTYAYAGGRYLPQRQDDALIAAYGSGLLHDRFDADHIAALRTAYERANRRASQA